MHKIVNETIAIDFNKWNPKNQMKDNQLEHLILIVDDDDSALFYLGTILRNAGFTPILASNTREARSILKSKQISAVISDLIIPDGGGLDLLSWVRSNQPNLPFLVMTAFGSVDRAVSSIQSGATDFLQKPLASEQLVKQLQHLIKKNEASSFNENESTIQIQLKIEKAEFSLETAIEKIKDLALHYSGGNKSKAADLLKINRKTFYHPKEIN